MAFGNVSGCWSDREGGSRRTGRVGSHNWSEMSWTAEEWRASRGCESEKRIEN